MVVEILMATYNGEKYLREQIDSIINQTYEKWILTIRDDGSKDKTLKLLEEYERKDKRIRLLKDEKGNLGYKKNFEELLFQSKGENIFLCDQDDVWNSNKIEICLEYLKTHTVVQHNAKVFYEFSREKKSLFERNTFKNKNKLFLFPNIAGCCLCFKRNLLDKILPIPEKYPGHDTWIGLLSIIEDSFIFIDKELMLYRRHGENTSFLSEKSKNSFYKKLKYRYYYLIYPIYRSLNFLKKDNQSIVLIDCMHTKEIFMALIEYYLNYNTALFLRESRHSNLITINRIKERLDSKRLIVHKYQNNNIKEKIFSRIRECYKTLQILLFYKKIKKIIFFKEGNIMFNILKYKKEVVLYEHGLINYQKLEEMYHGKKITRIHKLLLFFLGERIGTYGRDKKVKEIYLVNPTQSPIDIKMKVKKLDIKLKWDLLKEEDKKFILNIYGIENFRMKDYKNKVILLTQPISEQGFVSEKQKIQIYRDILKKYKSEEVMLKVHPREKTNYKNYFKCEILNGDFPIEILDLIDIKFKKAITLYSTAIDTFSYPIEKEVLGTTINETLMKNRGRI